jgi:ABC-2 type transport system ATP-binding protein
MSTRHEQQSTLVIDGLSKRYPGGTLANDGISLEIRQGEVYGLLGPNGAGKTTLVKQIIGLLKPTSGTIRLAGLDLVAAPERARQLCSYLPQGALPIDSLTLHEAVVLVGQIRGGDRQAVLQRAAQLIEVLELEEWTRTYGVKLSGGLKRLAGFIMAVVWPTSLVILDEPTNDVDPLRRRLLWNQIRALGQAGITVLLVSHNVLEAEQAVDRLAIIDRGSIVAQGTPSSLKAEDQRRLRLVMSMVTGAEPPPLPRFVRSTLRTGQRIRLLINEGDATDAIAWARSLANNGGPVEEYSLSAANLEDAYLRLIGREDSVQGLQAVDTLEE